MSRYDAIVIGAGVNGLVAAATLARRGKSVCVVEQRAEPGGMATLSLQDGPPLAHTLYNLSPSVLEDLGVPRAQDSFHSQPIATVGLCESSRHVVLNGSQARFADGTPHPDTAAVQKLSEQLVTYGDLLRHLGEQPPPGGVSRISMSAFRQMLRLGRLGLKLKGLGKPEMRRFLQLLLSNAHDLILDEIPDGPLAGILAADAVRGAAAGPRSPGTVFNLIYRMGHGGVVTYPVSGMQSAMDTCAAAAKALGCTILTQTQVTQVLIENDCVTGVAAADGTVLSARLVLAGCSPKRLLEMIGPDHENIETTRRVRNMRARGTVAKINLELDAPLSIPGLSDDLSGSRLLIAPSVDYVERAFNPAKYRQMSDHPVIEAVPLNHNGTPWVSMIVQYAPSDLDQGWTNAARQDLLRKTTETLARFIPTLPAQITGSQVITPDQIQAATGSPGGHWHHAEMTLDQILTLRPAIGLNRYQMGPKGLFLCGASSHPGGDIMGLAGRNAAKTALETGS